MYIDLSNHPLAVDLRRAGKDYRRAWAWYRIMRLAAPSLALKYEVMALAAEARIDDLSAELVALYCEALGIPLEGPE
jgi:hypothetical protein